MRFTGQSGCHFGFNMFGIPYSVGKGQVKDATLFDTFLKFYFSALSILNNESMKFNDFFENIFIEFKEENTSNVGIK